MKNKNKKEAKKELREKINRKEKELEAFNGKIDNYFDKTENRII